MIPRFVEFKVNVLAQEFIDWFTYQVVDQAPVERFYDILLKDKFTSRILGFIFEDDNEWVWTPAKTSHDDKIWWRVYVDITDSSGERRIEEDGALACCLTQISGNPTAPRLEVQVSWSHLFAGSAWEFIEAVGKTYPETADAISAWQASEEGRAARLAWVNSSKYQTSLSRSKIEALHRLPVQELVSRGREDPASLWICEKLDRFAVEYAMARSTYAMVRFRDTMLSLGEELVTYEDLKAFFKAKAEGAKALEECKAAEERVKAWEEYRKHHPHESTPASSPFAPLSKAAELIAQGPSAPIIIPVPSAGQGEEKSGAGETQRQGREPDPLYDRAWEKIQQEGLSRRDAWEWYCESLNIPEDNQKGRNAFYQAMRRRKNKGVNPTKPH